MENIYKQAQYLRWIAEAKAEKENKSFEVDNYKWILGRKIFDQLKPLDAFRESFYENPTLMGINILCDYENPEILELWERIRD